MRAAILVLVFLCGLGVRQARGAETATSAAVSSSPAASAPAVPSDPAVRSLLHSAAAVVHAPGAPGQQARLEALARMAQRLAPGDPEVDLLLAAQVYRLPAQAAASLQAQEKYLAACPQDWRQNLRWLALATEAAGTQEKKAELLRSTAARADLPASLRGQAWAELARLLRDGERAQRLEACRQALALDPWNAEAWAGRLSLLASPSPADLLEAMLGMIRAAPFAADSSRRAAIQLDRMGLHRQAAEFLAHAWQVTLLKTDQVQLDLAIDYLNALLSAGEHRAALTLFLPLLKQCPQSSELRWLLAEAYRAVGEADKAENMLREAESILEARRLDAATAAETAMFYLAFRADAERALRYARQAAGEKASPLRMSILGAAELLGSDPTLRLAGIDRLKGLVKQDAFAAAFLAGVYYSNGDAAAGEQALQAGASAGRSGPGFRILSALAARHKVVLPPANSSQKVLDVLEAFDRRYLELGGRPEKFISVAIEPVKEALQVGEPLEVEAALINQSQLDVPLGPDGGVNPTLSLRVRVAKTQGDFENLPAVVWPAPRCLPAGQTLRCRLRVDVGWLNVFLSQRPLEELTLTVSGTLDPRAGQAGVSGLPTVDVKPATVRRLSLLQADVEPAAAYQVAVERLRAWTQTGSLQQRMLAAGQIACLLAVAGEDESGGRKVSQALARAVRKDELLGLLGRLLKDRSPSVRAEAVACLACVRLDGATIAALAGAIEDPSPLVRLRVVELLAESNSPGHDAIVSFMLKDEDELVRLMASAFQMTNPTTAP